MKNGQELLPTTFLDNETILAYRKQSQTLSYKEDLWSWYVLRRISIYLTILFCKMRIKPNTISWMSVFFILISGLSLVIATPLSIILAALFYNIGYLLDCVDGEVARITKQTSSKGYYIDIIIQAAALPVFLSMVLTVLRQAGMLDVSILEMVLVYATFVAIIMALLVPIAYQLTKLTMSQSTTQDPVNSIRDGSLFFDIVAVLLGLPGFFVAVVVIIIVEQLTGVDLLLYYISFFLAMLVLKTGLRVFITSRSFDKS
ncbi:CDP-alcohol phosphatidyltransferase family protein [Alkalihalobacillus hwajinpoensis]|uniref:CDP-alcohol phosphatidyltransferase family protein n=1 Tax=Guptibacillus hwajinpoensis TaxID=208199 RepID=UPI0018832E6C|nr:CDP-alcohol phosphatidyltransferase family protein [Pseudalkalibacillus hwajinpoensis]MBF0705540.1 CDP-alcohol phosphatidyltransferase family protein [Pseudalkalibacillus hwajinpoensis]